MLNVSQALLNNKDQKKEDGADKISIKAKTHNKNKKEASEAEIILIQKKKKKN